MRETIGARNSRVYLHNLIRTRDPRRGGGPVRYPLARSCMHVSCFFETIYHGRTTALQHGMQGPSREYSGTAHAIRLHLMVARSRLVGRPVTHRAAGLNSRR